MNVLRAEKERFVNFLKTGLEDGVLFYVQYDDEEQQSVKSKRQWISDEKKQKQVLQSLHDDSSGGCHFGQDEIKFPVDISGMGSVMMFISTSRPVTSVRRSGFIYSLYF